MHEVLVNRLGGLSLPRKSVVRLTDRPDMTLDVYRGRKPTKQQPHNERHLATVNKKNMPENARYNVQTRQIPFSGYQCSTIGGLADTGGSADTATMQIDKSRKKNP